MPYSDILYDKRDAIATITLNRPQAMNACTIKTYDEMLDALRDAEADDSVRVVVLTGAGRAFCAVTTSRKSFSTPSFATPNLPSALWSRNGASIAPSRSICLSPIRSPPSRPSTAPPSATDATSR